MKLRQEEQNTIAIKVSTNETSIATLVNPGKNSVEFIHGTIVHSGKS